MRKPNYINNYFFIYKYITIEKTITRAKANILY